MPYLLRDIDHESGICLEFIQEAVARFPEDDSIVELFVKAMVDISTQLSTMSMNDDYRPHVNVSHSSLIHYLTPLRIKSSDLASRPSNYTQSSLRYWTH